MKAIIIIGISMLLYICLLPSVVGAIQIAKATPGLPTGATFMLDVAAHVIDPFSIVLH